MQRRKVELRKETPFKRNRLVQRFSKMPVAPLPAPVVVASAEPLPAPRFAPVERANKPVNSLQTATVPAKSVETQVAEALLAPQTAAGGQRVVIRFVSQRANGCGSLKGNDIVCVAQATGTGM